MTRWLGWPQILYTAPVPLMVAAIGLRAVLGLRDKEQLRPFLASLGLFVLSYIGIAISFYPYIVPELDHDLGGRRARHQPGVPARRRRRADPDDPRLYRLFLLGVSRQGERARRGVSLMRFADGPAAHETRLVRRAMGRERFGARRGGGDIALGAATLRRI